MMSCSDTINPDLLSFLAAIIAVVISQERNAGDLNVIGNFIVSVGSLVLTEAAQIENQKTKEDKDDQIKYIQLQIEHLQNQLERIKDRN